MMLIGMRQSQRAVPAALMLSPLLSFPEPARWYSQYIERSERRSSSACPQRTRTSLYAQNVRNLESPNIQS